MAMDPLMQSLSTELSIKTITEIEELAEEIMTDKAQIIDCDKKRNSNREALRTLKSSCANKEWFCIGNLFIKVSRNTSVKILEDDQTLLDEQTQQIQNGLKAKIKTLHQLEGRQDVKGFDLKNINSA